MGIKPGEKIRCSLVKREVPTLIKTARLSPSEVIPQCEYFRHTWRKQYNQCVRPKTRDEKCPFYKRWF